MAQLGSIFEHVELPPSPFSLGEQQTVHKPASPQPLFETPVILPPESEQSDGNLAVAPNVVLEIVPVPTKDTEKEYQPDLVKMERNFDNLLRWAFRDKHAELSNTSLMHQGSWLVDTLEVRVDKNGRDRYYVRGQRGTLHRISRAAYLDIRFFDAAAPQNSVPLTTNEALPVTKEILYGTETSVRSFATRMAFNQPIEKVGRQTSVKSLKLGTQLDEAVYTRTNVPIIQTSSETIVLTPDQPEVTYHAPTKFERRSWARSRIGRIAAAACLLLSSVLVASTAPEQPAQAQSSKITVKPAGQSSELEKRQGIVQDPEYVLMTWEIDHQRTDGPEAVAAFAAASPEAQQNVVNAELKEVLNGRYRYYGHWMINIISDVQQKLAAARQGQSSFTIQ